MKIIILHGRQSRNKDAEQGPQNTRHRLGWLQKACTQAGHKAYNPLIPKDREVNYKERKKAIETLDAQIHIDSNTVLIGTSAGGAFWVRRLGETGKSIHKLILVAPTKQPSENKMTTFDKKNGFRDFEIDESIPQRVKEIVIFSSDNESAKQKIDAQLYTDTLQAKFIELPGRGHFTTTDNPINATLPEVLTYLN